MHKSILLLLVAALLLLATGGFLVSDFLTADETPPLQWSEHEEIELDLPADALLTDAGAPLADRTEVEAAAGALPAADDTRVEVLLRGRVVDRYGAPQAGANVWLDFGRGGPRGQRGRQRRVPDPVTTDADGRFAFRGQTFRSLRVSLQVLHRAFAPGVFDRDVGQVDAEVELGDLVIERGGELIGRVTDLDGNGIAGAAVELQPENGNRMRFLRERDQLLAPAVTDNNGYYRRPNVTAGDWSVTATAKMHTEGRSSVFAVENERAVDVEDIRLGPGYEVHGEVRSYTGTPVAGATVELRGGGEGRRRGGAHATTTDARGQFFLEHLPGLMMQLDVRAEGFLPFQQDDVDPRLAQPLRVTLLDGLKITGTVVDSDGAPVTRFAARAVRVRGLPVPGQEDVDVNELFARLRSGDLDAAERDRIRARIEDLRGAADRAMRQRGERGGGRGRDRGDDRPEDHPGGRFALTGLQEGVYEVLVESPDHARLRSAEVELRQGSGAPDLRLQLDGGVYLAGIVLDERDLPVANATVTLRTPTTGRRGRDGNGDAGGPPMPFGRDFGSQFATALNVEARTDVDGKFVLTHLPRGSYRLQASADGYANASVEPFEVDADRSGVRLVLGTLGAITGTVFGLADGEFAQARVAAVPTSLGSDGGGFRGRGPGGGGPFRTGEIAADGSYRIENLTPGDYIVRSWLGSPQELMRELGPKLFDGSLVADVTVRGGEEQHLDVELHRARQGTVAGSILLNGSSGSGLFVDLTRQDDDATASPDEGMRGGRMRGMFGSQNATVADSGNFKIENVPAGTYRLRVLRERRQGLLHEEVLDVLPDTTTERHLSLSASRVVGTITVAGGGADTELDGSALLLPGLTEPPASMTTLLLESSLLRTRIRDGAFEFAHVAPGSYLLTVNLRGREASSQVIQVGAGELRVQVAAGAVSAAAPGAGSSPTGSPTLRQPQPR